MLRISDGRNTFYQWDSNQKLIVYCDAKQVHFCAGNNSEVLAVEVVDGTANVPNVLLQTAGKIYAYAYIVDTNEKHTLCKSVFDVMARAKPVDYVYTETEVLQWETVSEAALNMIRNIQVNAYSGDTTSAEVSVEDDIITIDFTIETGSGGGGSGRPGQKGDPGDSAYDIAVDNGFVGTEEEWLESLKGEPGQDGASGRDGYTPVKGVDYFDGQNGVPGEDGYTPVKGVDYWTDADKQEIIEEAVNEIPVANVNAAGLVKPDNSTIIIAPDGTISATGGGGGGGTGENGGYYSPSVDDEGNLTWTASKSNMPTVAGANIMGAAGRDGQDGAPGAKGEPFTYEDFTQEQLAELKGEPGADGRDGQPGQNGYTPIKGVDYFDGQPGQNGQDGVSVTHSWDGTVLTITSASGTSSVDLQGAQGIPGNDGSPGQDGLPGADGEPGQDGYTPIRGTDYWTETDKSEIIAAAAELMNETYFVTKTQAEYDALSTKDPNVTYYIVEEST